MAKDPAFLFYPNDYIGGTMGMTFEEKGAYIELLMMQFNRGHMDGHMIGHTVGQLWDKIKTKFIQDEAGLWYNKRLEIEKNKRIAYSNSRRNNIEGKNQYNNDDHMGGHMTIHMENENINENINTSSLEKEENEIPKFEFVPFPKLISNPLDLTYEQTLKTFEEQQARMEKIAMEFKSDLKTITDYSVRWLKEQNLKGQFPRNIKETNRHFYNAFKLHIEEVNKKKKSESKIPTV